MRPICPAGEMVWYRANWRELQARDYSLQPADEYVERYRKVLREKEASGDGLMIAAHLIAVNGWLRCQVESYTMAGLTPEEICTRFYLDPTSVMLFQKVFCDIEPLKEFHGSLLQACFDSTVGKDVARMRLFGLRYGQVFLDWMLSKMTTLDEDQFALIENRLRTALLMKATEIEVAPLSDSERYDMLLKVIKTLHQYKSTLSDAPKTGELEEALEELKNLVTAAPAPKGLSAEVLAAEIALPNPGNNRLGMN